MISIYLIIAIVCAILLIVSVALGGLADHDIDLGGHDFDLGGAEADIGGPEGPDMGYGDFHGAGISPLSLPIVLAFGTTFGSVGALLELGSLDAYVIPLIAIVASVAVAGIMYFAISRMFVKTQASSNVNPRDLLGRDATVSVAIRPGKLGQVLVVTEERGRTLMPAIADETIPTDAAVTIIEIAGGSARVKKR